MDIKTQASIYLIAFLAGVSVSYAAGYTQGKFAGEQIAHKAWIEREAMQDAKHKLELHIAKKDGACKVAVAALHDAMRRADRAGQLELIQVMGSCALHYEKHKNYLLTGRYEAPESPQNTK